MPIFPYRIIKYYIPTYIELLNQEVCGELSGSTDGALESQSGNGRDPEKAMILIDYCYAQLKLDLNVDLCETCIRCFSVCYPEKGEHWHICPPNMACTGLVNSKGIWIEYQEQLQ